ncbi:MAG: 4-hydroxy-3-methylbut-2-enyl diphosphate reductase, partial [Lachnospiraceae bacterium]|nr:4-hydroxy-3-methylbut-2-enyl diphosphate reductase [Lachnospiraceae bacterium]
LASKVDVMLVIGGKHSSNTQKLYEICRKECNNTYYIQTVRDLKPEWLDGKQSVGITAGASTPNHIIEEVHTNVRVKF